MDKTLTTQSLIRTFRQIVFLQKKQETICKVLNIKQLSALLQNDCSYIFFAYLYGSSQDGVINPHSDIDIAVYLSEDSYKAQAIIDVNKCFEKLRITADIDVTFFNNSTPLLAFEALCGRRLFVREEALELYSGYYSLTCREYESENYWMKKQLEYRGYEIQWSD